MLLDLVYFTALGIMTGGLYGLLGLGLNLIFGVMRVINVSHGEMLTLGAYSAIVLGLTPVKSPWFAVAVAVVVVTAGGFLVARLLLQPITVEGRVHEQRGLVLTLGLSFVVANLILAIFGPEFQKVPGQLAEGAYLIGDLVLEKQRIVILAASIVIAALLMLFLKYTLVGRAIRAVGENPEAAQACGISVRRIHLLTFALGSALAGVSGALITPATYAMPAMGFNYTLYAFTVVIIGGLGSMWGALLAGFLLGIAESVSVLWLPSGYNAIVGPMLMLAMLIVRPQGLLGRLSVRA
jgi:branched-chain amino acid transport system permease protein